MIEAKELTKAYRGGRLLAVDALSLNVGEGEVVGLAGPNGAGKTTTLKLLSGITLPNSGSAAIDGFDIVKNKVEACGRLGFVPDVPIFEADSSVKSILTYFAELSGIPKVDRISVVNRALEEVGLAKLALRRPHGLSLGMRKRLSFAIGLLGSPRNVLLDELFNGLDPNGLRYIKDKIAEIRKDGGSVLMSSHVLSELQNLADRVVIIQAGRLVESVKPSELIDKGYSNVKIVVENPDERLSEFLRQYGDLEISGKTYKVGKAKGDVKTINSQLVKMGYVVSELTISENILEDYFREKTGLR